MDLDEKAKPRVCGFCHRQLDQTDAIPCEIVRASTPLEFVSRNPDWRKRALFAATIIMK